MKKKNIKAQNQELTGRPVEEVVERKEATEEQPVEQTQVEAPVEAEPTKEEATEEKPPEFLIGVREDLSVIKAARLEEIDGGLKVIESVAELMEMYSLEQLNQMYGKIAGGNRDWKSKQLVGDSLWHQFKQMSFFKPGAPLPTTEERRGAPRGPRVREDVVYVLQYKPGKDPARDEQFRKLPPQAQVCVRLMLEFNTTDADTVEIKEPALREKVMANKEALHTCQDPWRIFQYYRPKLNQLNFILVH
jgi:hypothetical protein